MNHVLELGPLGNSIRVGGEYASNPTPLILSMFHPRDSTLIDPEKGLFDKDTALMRLQEARDLSERYQIPLMIAIPPEYVMIPFLDWLADEWPGIIVLDGYIKAKLQGLQHAKELGILDRVVFNSVGRSTTEAEWDVIRESTPQTAMLQLSGYDAATRYSSIHYPINGTPLVEYVQKTGVKNVIIDLSTTGLASMADVIETYFMIKKTLPYPAGSVPANIREFERVAGTLGVGEMDRDNVVIASNAIAYFFGDFTYAGPIAWARKFFETAAMMEEIKHNIKFNFGEF